MISSFSFSSVPSSSEQSILHCTVGNCQMARQRINCTVGRSLIEINHLNLTTIHFWSSEWNERMSVYFQRKMKRENIHLYFCVVLHLYRKAMKWNIELIFIRGKNLLKEKCFTYFNDHWSILIGVVLPYSRKTCPRSFRHYQWTIQHQSFGNIRRWELIRFIASSSFVPNQFVDDRDKKHPPAIALHHVFFPFLTDSSMSTMFFIRDSMTIENWTFSFPSFINETTFDHSLAHSNSRANS